MNGTATLYLFEQCWRSVSDRTFKNPTTKPSPHISAVEELYVTDQHLPEQWLERRGEPALDVAAATTGEPHPELPVRQLATTEETCPTGVPA